jgi:hypothetical protein
MIEFIYNHQKENILVIDINLRLDKIKIDQKVKEAGAIKIKK